MITGMDRIGQSLGDLLWRRFYAARVESNTHVVILAATLESLLKQAGVQEPEDDRVSGPGGIWRGRTMNIEP